MNNNKIPLITIVTVSYQAQDEILKTLESITEQTFSDFEYIIIDGKSTDKTIEKIEYYLPKFRARNISVSITCEKDNGIYDAMNKGIEEASGQWIIFINAGDAFYEKDTLEKVKDCLKTRQEDIIYANEFINEPGNAMVVESNDCKQLPEGKVLFHQSTFVKTEVMKKNLFSLEYKIAGDYELFLRLYSKGYTFYKLDAIIADFAYGGISSIKPIICLQEKVKIRKKYNCIKQTEKGFRKWYYKEYIVAIIKTILPRNIDLWVVRQKEKLGK